MHHILIFGVSIPGGRNVSKADSLANSLVDYIDENDNAGTMLYNLSIAGETIEDVLIRILNETKARCNKVKHPDVKLTYILQ